MEDYIIKAIEEWVNKHPAPDKPILQLGGTGQVYSPRKLLEEMQKDTDIGQKHKKMIIQLAVDIISGKFKP